MVAMAEPSLAARREARRLGIAIAAMMPMIATTMRSSINENPSWRLVVMLITCSFMFEYLRSTELVAKRCHRRAHNQSSRVGDRGQRVVTIHHTDFSDAETAGTGLRNTTSG